MGVLVDMTYPVKAEAFRTEVRQVLAEELPAGWQGIGAIATEAEAGDFVARRRAALHRRGLLGITWPVTYGGRGLSQPHQVVLVEEVTQAGLSGEIRFCQGSFEPSAGGSSARSSSPTPRPAPTR